jgi:hypothetical protein
MFLLEKDNLIHNISDKLRATLPKLDGESYTVVNGLISELNFSLNNKRWDEFEAHASGEEGLWDILKDKTTFESGL